MVAIIARLAELHGHISAREIEEVEIVLQDFERKRRGPFILQAFAHVDADRSPAGLGKKQSTPVGGAITAS